MQAVSRADRLYRDRYVHIAGSGRIGDQPSPADLGAEHLSFVWAPIFSDLLVTNAPLVVRSLDDALLAAIELHDLPTPEDDEKTPNTPGAGCPVPKETTNVIETAADISPAIAAQPRNQSKRRA